MNWSDWIVENIVPSIIGAGVLIFVALLKIIIDTSRNYKRLIKIIGEGERGTLNKQHENIEEKIEKNSTNLNAEVRKLVDYNIKAEGLTNNLNTDQKELKNSVNQVISQWQILIKENQELREKNKLLTVEKCSLKEKLSKSNIEENVWGNEM